MSDYKLRMIYEVNKITLKKVRKPKSSPKPLDLDEYIKLRRDAKFQVEDAIRQGREIWLADESIFYA